MATLARKVGGGLDAVIAMTGHKDIKLTDHYSKCDEEDQKDVSLKVMEYIKNQSAILSGEVKNDFKEKEIEDSNVISLFSKKIATNH